MKLDKVSTILWALATPHATWGFTILGRDNLASDCPRNKSSSLKLDLHIKDPDLLNLGRNLINFKMGHYSNLNLKSNVVKHDKNYFKHSNHPRIK